MALDIYLLVKEILGILPVELEFLYGICTCGLFFIIIYCIFVMPIQLIFGK